MDEHFEAFIQALPKTETHLHIEGALPFELLQQSNPEAFSVPPVFCQTEYRFDSLEGHFLPEFYRFAAAWFTSLERYHQTAQVLFAKLVSQNIHYVETSFHIPMLESIGCSGEELIDAIKSAAPANLSVKVFGGFSPLIDWPELRALIESSLRWEHLDGIDSHGLGTTGRYDWQPGFWKAAREAGKVTKVHVGEIGCAADVCYGISDLGSTRIQHGIRAVDDLELLKRLRDEEVTLDVCPISNYKLRASNSLELHPFRKLFEAGIRCTVSTDDPFFFHNTVLDEYRALRDYQGFTLRELAKVARHGFESALLGSEEKKSWLDQIDSLSASL